MRWTSKEARNDRARTYRTRRNDSRSSAAFARGATSRPGSGAPRALRARCLVGAAASPVPGESVRLAATRAGGWTDRSTRALKADWREPSERVRQLHLQPVRCVRGALL